MKDFYVVVHADGDIRQGPTWKKVDNLDTLVGHTLAGAFKQWWWETRKNDHDCAIYNMQDLTTPVSNEVMELAWEEKAQSALDGLIESAREAVDRYINQRPLHFTEPKPFVPEVLRSYDVTSDSYPSMHYNVQEIRLEDGVNDFRCECADYTFRGPPKEEQYSCKHIFRVFAYRQGSWVNGVTEHDTPGVIPFIPFNSDLKKDD